MFSGNIPTPANGFNLKVEYSYYQPPGENYTDVTANGYIKRNNSTYYPYNSTSLITLNIGGNIKTYTGGYNINQNGYILLISHTARIPHNADGTKSINITFSVDGKLTNWYPIGSISQDITLPQIKLASDVSVSTSSVEIGNSCNININRYSSFTHKLEYNFMGLTGVIGENIATGYTWTIPDSFYSVLTTLKSGTCSIICTTYNGSQVIGTKTCDLIIQCKASECYPDVSVTIVDSNEVTKKITGNQNKCIKHMSNLFIKAVCTAKKGASISRVTCDGVLMDMTTSGSQVIATTTIYGANKDSYTITAYDGRNPSGYIRSISQLIDMYNYIPLTCSANIKRPYATSTSATLKVSGNYYNGNLGTVNNSLTVTWKYRPRGTPYWIVGGTIENVNFNNGTFSCETVCEEVFDYKTNYEVIVTVKDKLSTAETTTPLIKGESIISFSEKGIKIFGVNIIDKIASAIMSRIYPVVYPINSIKIFYDNEDHSNFLGLTWVRACIGRVPVGVNPAESEFSYIGQQGGEKYHTLSWNEMPEHNHAFGVTLRTYYQSGTGVRTVSYGNGTGAGNYVEEQKAGANWAHNNMQPYEVVAYWRRIQ